MKKIVFLILISIILFGVLSCRTKKVNDNIEDIKLVDTFNSVYYKRLVGYKLKHNIDTKERKYFVFYDKDGFDTLFVTNPEYQNKGISTINWGKQAVMGIVWKMTDIQTRLSFEDLSVLPGDRFVFTYQVLLGKHIENQYQPYLFVIVNKKDIVGTIEFSKISIE